MNVGCFNIYKYFLYCFQKKLGAIYTSFTFQPLASCRYGIEIVLRALVDNNNINQDSYVILPSYTCQVVENAVISAGCIPLYCDINSEDWSVSFDEYSRIIQDSNHRNKSIIAFIMQHTYGITPKDRDRIIKLSNINSIHVIEDIAHCSHLKNYYSTFLKDSTCIVGSFQASKSVSSFQGGFIGINKNNHLLNMKLIHILKSEKQHFSLRLLISQLLDSTLNTFGFPFNSFRKMRVLISFLYKGMSSYEKNFDRHLYIMDFLRRGKANLITLFFLNSALSKIKYINKRRASMTVLYDKYFKINSLITEQIKKGNVLLLWPISNKKINYKIIEKVNKRYISNWFNPIIFPNSSVINLSISNQFPKAESISKNDIRLHTLFSRKDFSDIKSVIDHHFK